VKSFALSIAAAALLTIAGCSTTVPNRVPVGEPFPSVQGKALTKEAVSLPADLDGKPAILIVAYRQRAQFDCDRWLNSLTQFATPVTVLEVPTIPDWAPRQFSSQIDEGMRGGIPESAWGSVVTVYKDGHLIRDFTGNDGGQNARVMLLDGDGRVVWFHDSGYGSKYGVELDRLARELALKAATTPR